VQQRDAAAPAILASGVEKSFGEVRALAGLDLEVAPGTVLGLLGPNGAGKTTAVRVLTTLLAPDAGTARVAGLDVVRDAAALRAHIGLAGQYAAVDENLTGAENLVMVGRLYGRTRSVARRRAQELLERFDLVDAAKRPVKTIRAACAAAWTSPRRSSPARPCCSSTSRPRAWIPAAAWSCGRRSRPSSRRGPRCC